jgi:hypothetical protein
VTLGGGEGLSSQELVLTYLPGNEVEVVEQAAVQIDGQDGYYAVGVTHDKSSVVAVTGVAAFGGVVVFFQATAKTAEKHSATLTVFLESLRLKAPAAAGKPAAPAPRPPADEPPPDDDLNPLSFQDGYLQVLPSDEMREAAKGILLDMYNEDVPLNEAVEMYFPQKGIKKLGKKVSKKQIYDLVRDTGIPAFLGWNRSNAAGGGEFGLYYNKKKKKEFGIFTGSGYGDMQVTIFTKGKHGWTITEVRVIDFGEP